jgi:hypothetical protein
MEEQREGKSNRCLRECLAQADSSTAHKWSESQRISWFSIGCQEPLVVLILGVETFRLKLLGFRPLIRIMMNRFKGNKE